MKRQPARQQHLAAAAALAAVALSMSCTSGDDTPLGTRLIDDLLGSRPGVVFQDTIEVTSGDTTVAFDAVVDQTPRLQIGRFRGYTRMALLRPDLSGAGVDTTRVVAKAFLRVNVVVDNLEASDRIGARFLRLGTPYAEGDSIAAPDTTSAIDDPSTGSAIRDVIEGTLSYELPADLVQGWIRGDSASNGVAIVATATVERFLEMESSEGADGPDLQVNFVGGFSSNYPVNDDGTLVRPASPTPSPDLVVSDGYVRRIHFSIDVSQIDDSATVHGATVRLNLVPGSVFGGNQKLVLYVPDSADPADPAFLDGRRVTEHTLDDSTGVAEFTITNVLLLELAGEVEDNGFVIRFDGERSEVRQAAFYSSANSALRPRVDLTYSTPARFGK